MSEVKRVGLEEEVNISGKLGLRVVRGNPSRTRKLSKLIIDMVSTDEIPTLEEYKSESRSHLGE